MADVSRASPDSVVGFASSQNSVVSADQAMQTNRGDPPADGLVRGLEAVQGRRCHQTRSRKR
jgi:hypothetical protein